MSMCQPGATVVIIGRAGSKGFPCKNSKLLLGRPMVWYSLEDAAQAKSVERIVVSTDCSTMGQQAEEWIAAHRHSLAAGKSSTLVKRPQSLAGDKATVDSAVRHAVAEADAEVVVILYGNVPIRPDGIVDRAVERLISSRASSVQSYAPVGKYHPYWEVTMSEAGEVTPYVDNCVYRRQDLPPVYVPDGGVIAVRREFLMQEVEGAPHAFLGPRRLGIVNGIGEVIDIDDPIDLTVAEAVLARKRDIGAAA